MLKSNKINDLNKKIHELIVKKPDHNAWKFDDELHKLIALRDNLRQQLLKEGTSTGYTKSLADFQTLNTPRGEGRKEQ